MLIVIRMQHMEDGLMIKIFAVLFAVQTILSPVSSWEPAAEDVEAIARTLYGECRGAETVSEQEAVAWVILNRLDAGYADTVLGVVSAPGQFAGYSPEHPLWPELVEIAERVLRMHHREQLGESVERVLPREYLWFSGDGVRNYFRCEYDGERVMVDAEL